MRRTLSLLVGLFGLLSLSAADHNDAAGTYYTSTRVDKGKVSYTLRLDRSGKAQLRLESTRGTDRDRGTIEKYGTVMHRLAHGGVVVHNGRWTQRGDRITIDLEGRRGDGYLKGRIYDQGIKFYSVDEHSYGYKFPTSFRDVDYSRYRNGRDRYDRHDHDRDDRYDRRDRDDDRHRDDDRQNDSRRNRRDRDRD